MATFILFLYSFFETRRKQLFIGTALFMVVSLFFAAQIGLNEDIAKATSNSSEKQQNALKSLNIENKMFVIISRENGDGNSFKQMSGAATKIAEKLKELQPDAIKDILYTVDQKTMKEVFDFVALHPYLYLDKDDYETVKKKTTTVAIKNRLEQKYRQLLTPAGFVIKESLFRDPLDITPLAMKKFSHLQKSGNIHLKNGFFLSDDEKHLIIFITLNGSSNETSKNAEMLKFVRKTIAQAEQKNISVSLFGPVVIADENAKIAKKDITLSLSITLILLILLTALFFRKTYSILIILLPALCGGVTAIAIFSIAGHPLSAIALGIGSMMLGITVDYAIHLYTHYLSSHSITEALKEVVKPIITGALTTILAFLSLFSVSLHVLHDLALFSALSVAISAIFTLVVLPHIVDLLPQTKQKSLSFSPAKRLTAIHIPTSIKITIVVLLTAFLGFFSSKTEFDDDLNQMKYTSPTLQHSENLFNSIVGNNDDSIYFASAGESPERALLKSYKTATLLEKFKQKKMITSFVSPAQFVLPREIQIEKIEQWNNFWTGEKKGVVTTDLANSARVLHFKKDAFTPFLSLLQSVPQTLLATKFTPISSTLFREQIKISPSSSLIITTIKLPIKHKPAVASKLQNSLNGTLIDSGLIIRQIIQQVKEDLPRFIMLSLLMVFTILLLFFRRVELVMIALTPILLSWIWSVGLMALFDIKFNIFNIIIVTFVFGLGIDYALFLLQGMLIQYRNGKNNLRSFHRSILFSALTTLIGVSALLFATHPAIFSIAQASLLAIATVTAVTIVTEPLIFYLMITRRVKQNKAPIYITNGIHSLFSFSIYFILLIVGFIPFSITILLPFRKKRKEKLLHSMIMHYSHLIIGALALKRRTINITSEFSPKKPVIFIANHSSWLDIFYILSLHPKIIMLVANWVWKMPIIGTYVKYAGFFTTTSEDIDQQKKYLAQKVKDGYSIVIFPEGTRSRDGKIHRFKKGAFYLSEILNIPIQPLILHGIFHMLPKKALIQEEVKITSYMLPQIAHTDTKHGTTHREKAKNIRQMMQDEYDTIIRRIETPTFFKQQVFTSILYRGDDLKSAFHQTESYLPTLDAIYKKMEETQNIIIIDKLCEIPSCFLALSLPNCAITVVVENEEMVAIAQRSYLDMPLVTWTTTHPDNISDNTTVIRAEKGGISIVAN